MANVVDNVKSKFASLFKKEKSLNEFQKHKLIHEYRTFYDINKDGSLTEQDFTLARDNICKLSGWKPGSQKYTAVKELFTDLWSNLKTQADLDKDGKISTEEWVNIWEKLYNNLLETKKKKDYDPELIEKTMPSWFNKYISYKFDLYDRTGDGVIDYEEFEYILSDFRIPAKDCKVAFTMFSKNGTIQVDLPYFRQLAFEYYFSDDPNSLGNYINGKLTFE